ncbi:DNA repair exonuclease [Vallitalea pronyensis]|uniref:DNA repair exonuclease n=1 Tax=Vallitalea pronyensis TaxID=1348613 RepID=A0A8J8SEQ3_9FIRM|nr:DNA repair exonuclease [Vallitalea pronyensis]QUI20846.1 DNA repair exonuclease [Vallitalea pronyensis]
MRFIHTGDVHIGMEFKQASFGSTFAKKRRYEIKETFYRILHRAMETEVDFLFISGDLFEDDYVTMGDLKEISGQLQKIAPTKVMIIAGNHDPIMNNQSKYSMMDIATNVYIMDTHVDKISFDELNVDIYGLSWNKKTIKERMLRDLAIEDPERMNILLAHGDVYQKSEYLPIDKEHILQKGFDYIALGHIHKHDFIAHNMAYPGSPEPLDFSETGQHGFIEGTMEKGLLDVRFVPFAKREFMALTIDIDHQMTLEDMITKALHALADCSADNMYRLYFKGLRDKDQLLDKTYIKERIEEVITYAEIYDETQPNYDLTRLRQDNEGNVIGKFIAYMQEQDLNDEINRQALYEGVQALLSEKVKARAY